jgi:hypothetical protein
MKVSVTGDVPATPELSPLETAVLKVALGGLDHDALRAQLDRVEVASRTYSGVGFVTKFRFLAELSTAGGALPAVVVGTHPQLPDAVEFLVEIRDGRLHGLEAFCYEGMWPADESLFEVRLRD